MSEKRFKGYAEKTGQHYELIINDLLGEEYSLTDDFFKSKDVIFEIVDLLNVMNDTLLKQAEQNHKLSNKNIEQQATIQSLKEENSNLNSILNEVGLQKPFIKILDDYMIEYDGSCFSMHKPSDIRSFVYLMNRNNNFDELQCEYNDESMVIDDE